VSGQLYATAALPPREGTPGTNWIGGWVGPRAVTDAVVKVGNRTPFVHPVAQRYTIKSSGRYLEITKVN